MPEAPKPQRGFTIHYPDIARNLKTYAGVGLPLDYSAGETASFSFEDQVVLWDTGATKSCIKNGLAQQLNLPVVRSTKALSVDGPYVAKVYLASIGLPNRIIIAEIELLGCDDSLSFSMLIGMDVIVRGDFLVSTFGGMTTFSFQMPANRSLDLMHLQYTEADSGEKDS